MRGPGSPGSGGSGLTAIAAQAGSSPRSDPTSTRAATSPRRASPSSRSAARESAPSLHQESSSQKATWRPCARRTPSVRAAAPASSASETRRTRGCAARTASGVPSRDPLSTTTTSGRSGRPARASSVRRSSAHRSRVMITTETRLSPGDRVDASDAPVARSGRPAGAVSGSSDEEFGRRTRAAYPLARDRHHGAERMASPPASSAWFTSAYATRGGTARVQRLVHQRVRQARAAPQTSASSAWFTSASASAFWARGTERIDQRSKEPSASSAAACSGRMSGCLTLYSPLTCLATSSESLTTSTSVAPSACARARPSRSPRYSATLLVAGPSVSAASSRTSPSGVETTAAAAAGPGLPRAPPSTWTTTFTARSGLVAGDAGELARDPGPPPGAQLPLAAAARAGLAPRAPPPVDDDGDVRVVLVVRRELVVQLVGEGFRDDAVDHRGDAIQRRGG